MVDLLMSQEILLDFFGRRRSGQREELIEKLEELDKRMTSWWPYIVWTLWHNAILEIHPGSEEQKLRTGAMLLRMYTVLPTDLKLKSWTIRLEMRLNQVCDPILWRATCIRSSEIWNGRSPFGSDLSIDSKRRSPPLHLLRSCLN